MVCRKCKSTLSDSNWSLSRRKKRDYICSPCKSTEMRKFREYHKESLKENLEISRKSNHCCISCGEDLSGKLKMPYGSLCRNCCNVRAYANDKNTLEYKLWIGARNRAKNHKNTREFTIELSDVVIPNLCPVYSVPLVRALGNKGASDWSPTLDRIDSSKGYITGNIEVISWRANRLKSNGTLEDFEALVKHLKSK